MKKLFIMLVLSVVLLSGCFTPGDDPYIVGLAAKIEELTEKVADQEADYTMDQEALLEYLEEFKLNHEAYDEEFNQRILELEMYLTMDFIERDELLDALLELLPAWLLNNKEKSTI